MGASNRAALGRARSAGTPARARTLHLGRLEVASVLAGTVALAVLAGVGIGTATGRPTDAGLSVAIEGGGTASGDGTLRVLVANDRPTAFDGTVTASSGDVDADEDVAVAAGAEQVVELRMPKACGTTVTVTLKGTGASGQQLSVPLACAKASS